MSAPIRVEVDGRPATAADLSYPVVYNYGHFTSMQVRRGRTRGLDLHLRRLAAATDELFGAELDADRVRAYLRHALGDTPSASARVNVFDPDGRIRIVVAIRLPIEVPDTPQALRSVVYQRPVPHIKHVGSFGQLYHGRAAAAMGYNDALLTAADGTISETGISNVGFVERGLVEGGLVERDGAGIVWPDAPSLTGITMQLLDQCLPAAGLPTRRAPVRLPDLASVAGAFVANSNGIAPIGRVDDLSLPVDDRLMRTVLDQYAAVPWDLI